MSLCGSRLPDLDFGSLRLLQRVLYIDAQVANSAFDLGMAKQDLNSSQIAGCLVDDRRLRSAERMGGILLRLQANLGHSFPDEPGVLPRAHAAHVVGAARKDVVV